MSHEACTHEGAQKVYGRSYDRLYRGPRQLLCADCGSEVKWNAADFNAGRIPRLIPFRGQGGAR